MSGMRLTIGVMAKLEESISRRDCEDLNDRLSDQDSPLAITYDGEKVVFSKHDFGDYDDKSLVILDPKKLFDEFESEANMAGILFVPGSERIFVDEWYDGADSQHMTAKTSKVYEDA